VTPLHLVAGILHTDQYQLTMAQVYFRQGLHQRPARFDWFFRSYPDYGEHQAGYVITAGLEWLLEWMEVTTFTPDDIEALRVQRTRAGDPRFDDDFLSWLAGKGFDELTVHAVPEGRVVHANVPIVTVEGPLAMAQILETALLNRLNYQTLIATKASRVKEAARQGTVLDFGARRGPDLGAAAGSRAALIGGADYSSNVEVSHLLDFDPKGTHAHSLVQVFMALGAGELEAFRAFATRYPDECVLLVDTVDTLESGIPNAITVFRELEAKGHRPAGVRLDSGDLAYLAIRSTELLNDAGFLEVPIVLSSNLDELAIWQILSQIDVEAPRYGLDPRALAARLTYGVGTRLITSAGHSALNGVYKLVAVADDAGEWTPAIKVSENAVKVPAPGEKEVWRVYDERGLATADVIGLAGEDLGEGGDLPILHPHRAGVRRTIPGERISSIESLLEPVFANGSRTWDVVSIGEMRARRDADLNRLDTGVRRIVNPHIYHVSLTERMKGLQRSLIEDARDSVLGND